MFLCACRKPGSTGVEQEWLLTFFLIYIIEFIIDVRLIESLKQLLTRALGAAL